MNTNQLQIKITNLHWLDDDSKGDLCSHGNVLITFNDVIVDEVENEIWTTNSMVLELMRTCFTDFDKNKNINFLIPCCGFSMYPDESDPNKVTMLGCPSGFSWDIKHEGNTVIHAHKEEIVSMDIKDWVKQILALVKQIEDFYNGIDKNISDEGKPGYTSFWNEWNYLKTKISELL